MRLTLRTLLAYLDDRLSPGNARELGQKITKSPFALELVDRIKDVLRRRRLATDAPNQKMIDGNLIAEYLDDQLTPELVALIEKEILSSDHSLAEVAAAHQILGLLNDQVDISDKQKKRLYAMDPVADHDEPAGVAASVPVAETVTEWQPLTARTEPQKRSPMLLLSVMVVGWFVLLATDSNLFSLPKASTDSAVVDNAAAKEAIIDGALADGGPGDPAVAVADKDRNAPDAAKHDQLLEESPAPAATVVAAVPDATAEAAGSTKPAADSVDVAMKPDSTAAARPEAEPVETVPVAKLPPDGSTPAPPQPAMPDPDKPEIAVPASRSVGHIHLTDQFSMLVLGLTDAGTWTWGAMHGPGPGADWQSTLSTHVAGIAEPFSLRLDLPEAGWVADVLGSTLFRAPGENQPGVELVDGRMVIRRAEVAASRQSVEAAIKAGGRQFYVRIQAKNAKTGLQIIPLSDPGMAVADENADPDVAAMASETIPLHNLGEFQVYAAECDVVVRSEGSDQLITVPRGSLLRWMTGSEAPEEVVQAAPMPEWVYLGSQPTTEVTTTLLTDLSVALRKFDSLSGAVSSVSTDRNPQMAAYAVKIASLTRGVDDLVAMLLQSEVESVRRESISGLQQIMRQMPSGVSAVTSAMEKRLGETERDITMTLLSGITRTAAEDREVCAMLVASLESKRIAIRELAIYNLESLTGDRNGYFAGDDTSRRDGALRRWKRILERNDGLLLPAP